MNLGQSLLAILALVLFTSISVTINRARIGATAQTIEHQVELEAINYGQSLMEIISNIANTDDGYDNLESVFDNWQGERTFTTGSGRTLYAKIGIDTSPTLIKHDASYQKVTISIYEDNSRDEDYLKARYISSFNKWW